MIKGRVSLIIFKSNFHNQSTPASLLNEALTNYCSGSISCGACIRACAKSLSNDPYEPEIARNEGTKKVILIGEPLYC
jgi:ferredoxin